MEARSGPSGADIELAQAAKDGDLARARRLLALGADPTNACILALGPAGSEAASAFDMAAKLGDLRLLEAFLESGRVPDEAWRSAMSLALSKDDAGLARALAEDGKARGRRFGAERGGPSPLMLAAALGAERCLSLLLGLSDPAEADASGRDALMHAAIHGRLGCASALLAASDLDAQDRSGIGAQEHAARRGFNDLAGLIVQCRLSRIEARALRGTSGPPKAAPKRPPL